MSATGEKKTALIVANSEYHDEVLRQLVSPAADAEALASVLRDPLIGNFEVETLLDEPHYKVCEQVEGFFENRDRDHLLLLYFSGHGVIDQDGLLYFATANTQHNRLRSTAVAARWINEVMIQCRSRRQVLLLDCCHSGAFARSKAGSGVEVGQQFAANSRDEGRGRVVLTASDAIQYSFEGDRIDGEGARSIFTDAVVEGLRTGEADLNGDGLVSLDELYTYVHRSLKDQTRKQSPRRWDFDVEGTIVIARNPRPMTEDTRKRREAQGAVAEAAPKQVLMVTHSGRINSVAWSPDGMRLATGAGDKAARIWDAGTGRELNALVHQSDVFGFLKAGHAHQRITSVAWSPDGRRLASGRIDYDTKLWDAKSGNELLTLRGSRFLESIAWSPDGRRIATVNGGPTVVLWDADTGKKLLTVNGDVSVAWSPDGKRLATGSADNFAKIWDAATGECLFTLNGHKGEIVKDVFSVAWSPDGRRLATGSADYTAKIWNVEMGDTYCGCYRFTLGGHDHFVYSVAWSPDGKRLATGSADKTAKVWDAETGHELFTLNGHSQAVSSVAWHPDGKRLATGSWDDSARVWSLFHWFHDR